ncbi:hypothetical protein [Bradyrhizobium algeriense]|uniref:hypothetical protein n=1 Tax=Bradyrhizobium algeriense TaxID=634784 RepID=UPI000D3591C8|nr:hypothetical protein [Bradyrhizobium sp. CSA112]
MPTPTIINSYDLFALRAVPELSDECGGKITVLIDGRRALRKALTFGVDHIVRSLIAYSPGRHTGEQLCVGDRNPQDWEGVLPG